MSESSGKSSSKGGSGEANKEDSYKLPLLPLRDLIIFPHMMMPLFVGREKSINALEEAMSKQSDIVLQRLSCALPDVMQFHDDGRC